MTVLKKKRGMMNKEKEYDAIGLQTIADLEEKCRMKSEINALWKNDLDFKDTEIDSLTSKVERLLDALAALWVEWSDQKAQFGDQHLWKKHEDADAINLAKEALKEKGTV